MMGNSLLECVVFGRRAGRAAAEKASAHEHRHDHDLQHAVEDAAAHLYVWALKDIPQDLRDALADAARPRDVGRRASACSRRSTATSTSPTARATSSARTRASPSTTAASASTSRSTRRGSTRRCATAPRARRVEHPLRSNAVHTITRENTGPNIGYRLPIVHWEFIADWDGLDVKCVPKGSGSENMSFLKMCVPADGVKGIKQFVLESIVGAGGKPCPPGIVGVGIGGSADYAMYLAKEAIMRPIGTRNPDPLVAQLEDELFGLLNETGIGPMGLGGDVTVLQCHIEHADTHMTLNPVAVNYQCWAARRAIGAHRRRTATSTTTGSSDGTAVPSPTAVDESARNRCKRASTSPRRIGREGGGSHPTRVGVPRAGARRRAVLRARNGNDADRRRSHGRHEVTFPITDPREILKLRAGDEVVVQGHIIGIRDRTQIRIFDQGVEPPMDLPARSCSTPRRTCARSAPTGAATRRSASARRPSARMVRFTEPLGEQYGVRAICGKGGFPDEAIEPMQRLGMVYFAIVGGAAALETTQIEEIEEVAWEELMPECLWKFRVKDFGPLTVGIDAHGNSLYHDVQARRSKKLKEIYARL